MSDPAIDAAERACAAYDVDRDGLEENRQKARAYDRIRRPRKQGVNRGAA